MGEAPDWLEIGKILGDAYVSIAWVQAVLAAHAWIPGVFPRSPQGAAVWRPNPTAALSTATSSTTGRGRLVHEDDLLDGKWEFSSGVDAAVWLICWCDWKEPGASQRPLVPGAWSPSMRSRSSIVVRDGPAADGSKNVRLRQVRVPSDPVLELGPRR